MKTALSFSLSLPLAASFLLLTHCSGTPERQVRSSFFSLPVEVRFFAPESKVSTIQEAILKTLQSVENIFSTTDPESELSVLNRSEKLTWLPASRALVTVVEEALRVSDLTHGAWDFTAGKLNALYQNGKTPGPNTLEAAKLKTGYFHVEARKDPLAIKRSRRGFAIDLKALSIGYATDEVSEALRKIGVLSHRVAIGRVAKAASAKAIWKYSLDRPSGEALTTESIPLDNRAMVTVSALAENNAVLDYPLIDPRSGKPLVSDLTAVTTADSTALKAVGTAIALLVVGTTEGKTLAEKAAANAYFISEMDGKAVATSTALFPRTH